MKQYEKIINDIKDNILNKKLKAGNRLPSLNQMSKTYDVSKGTVIKAYETLQKQHIIYALPQSGYYVADDLIIDNHEDHIYHLETGNPQVNHHLFQEMKECLNIAAELYSFKTLDITTRGVDSLNELLPDYLSKDAIYANKKNIYLIQGIMQMLTLLTDMPFQNKKDIILIEEPSYSFYIRYLKSHNVPVMTIARDNNGIDLYKLEDLFKNYPIKFFYTIPRHHNPLGTYYDYHTRKKIMELAIKYDVYIVEDDYFSHYDSIVKYEPLYYHSNHSHCIYLRSYTKIIPFIRIGIAVIPDDFIDTMNRMIQLSYYYSYHMPSLVSQATLEAYIKSDLDNYQSRMISNDIKSKTKIIKNMTETWNNEIVLLTGYCGYYCSLIFHKDISIDKLIYKLKKEGILVFNNKNSFYHETDIKSIRLSLSRISIHDIEYVFKTIYQTILSLI